MQNAAEKQLSAAKNVQKTDEKTWMIHQWEEQSCVVFRQRFVMCVAIFVTVYLYRTSGLPKRKAH